MKPRISVPRSVAQVAAMSLMIGLVAVQFGCNFAQEMQSGDAVPASEGTVKATAGQNGNTNVTVHVKHLAPPAKVEADAKVYVVWIQPRNADKQNVGALKLDRNLEGKLETTTPHREFVLSVTPEPAGRVAQPSHKPVFISNVKRHE